MLLHKAAQGLLELFALKTLGKNPDQFGETVVPVVDVTTFYAHAELISTINSVPSVGAINAGGGLTNGNQPIAVPHLVFGIGGSILMGAAAGTFVNWSIYGRFPVDVATQNAPIASGQFSTTGLVGNVFHFGMLLPKPLVITAGNRLFVEVHGDAGGADHTLTFRLLSSFLRAA